MNFKTCVISTLITACVCQAGYSQQAPQNSRANEPKAITNNPLGPMMQKDLSTRTTNLGNEPVSWMDSGYGYYGTYSLEGTDYMSRYDREGKYIETLSRKTWNSDVPPAVRAAFEQSTYRSQQINGYWEVSDPAHKGYYFELMNDKGKTSRVWINDDGQFADEPSRLKPR